VPGRGSDQRQKTSSKITNLLYKHLTAVPAPLRSDAYAIRKSADTLANTKPFTCVFPPLYQIPQKFRSTVEEPRSGGNGRGVKGRGDTT
jgi:hypothetical protein